MIFTLVLYSFVLIGCLIMVFDWISYYMFGILIIPMVAMGLKLTGFILVFLGVVLYHGRASKTFGNQFIPLSDPDKTKCLHLGKSGAKILTGTKCEPNRIRIKAKDGRWMNIKDTGKSINLAGHDFTITVQDVGSNLPLWVCDVVTKWKNKYGIRNEQEFKDLHEMLSGIKSYKDLESISFLKPVLADPDKKSRLYCMKMDDLRHMCELLFDGREVGVKEYLDWADEATPFDNEAIIDSSISQLRAQDQKLADVQMMDIMKWVMPLAVLLIVGAIAYQIFGG